MNYKEVKKAINNYDQYKNWLLDNLKIYPVIFFSDYKKYAKDLYNK